MPGWRGRQKQRELASLQKKLAACRDAISWAEKRIAELNEIARGQMDILLGGATEPYFAIKATLQEVAEWQRELVLLREYEVSLPKEIEKLTAVSV
jgi:primosomal protein N''